MYLLAKLTALLIVALADPQNCLWHSLSERTVLLIRQTTLILAMLAFFIVQNILTPFINPISNASEWTSRASYLVTSILGLAGIFGGKSKAILQGPVLYV